MLRAAIVGIGTWGRKLVESVQGKSDVIRFVAGFRPTDTGFVLDPFPFDIPRLRLERLPFRGRSITIELTKASA